MCMERLFGIAFQQEGYDASKSVQGDHFSTPFETPNFKKKFYKRKWFYGLLVDFWPLIDFNKPSNRVLYFIDDISFLVIVYKIILNNISSHLDKLNIDYDSFISKVNPKGIKVLD